MKNLRKPLALLLILTMALSLLGCTSTSNQNPVPLGEPSTDGKAAGGFEDKDTGVNDEALLARTLSRNPGIVNRGVELSDKMKEENWKATTELSNLHESFYVRFSDSVGEWL